MILLAAAFLAAGLGGIAAFWVTWPRTSNTFPLAEVGLVWSCTYVVTALLTGTVRASQPPPFLRPWHYWCSPCRSFSPGASFLLPSFMVIVLVAFLGYRYLRKAGELKGVDPGEYQRRARMNCPE